MIVQKFLKTPEKILKFYEFNINYNKNSLTWLAIIALLLLLGQMVVDIQRAGFELILTFRLIQALGLIAMIFVGQHSTIGVKYYNRTLYIFTSIMYLMPFCISHFCNVPQFFLPNFIYLYLFTFNVILGHPYSFRFWQTLIVAIIFSIYAIYWSPFDQIHSQQIYNLWVLCGVSLAGGWLIERYKVLNFLKKLSLDESNMKLANDSELKSKLLSMLSHDLSSPISNLSSLIKLQSSDHLSDTEIKTHFNSISNVLDGLSLQMNSILNWTRMQLNGYKANIQLTDVDLLITNVVSSLDYAINAKDLKVTTNIKVNHQVYIEKEVVIIALNNLFANAIKYSLQGGQFYRSFNRGTQPCYFSEG